MRVGVVAYAATLVTLCGTCCGARGPKQHRSGVIRLTIML
jgi:hypothetical protein